MRNLTFSNDVIGFLHYLCTLPFSKAIDFISTYFCSFKSLFLAKAFLPTCTFPFTAMADPLSLLAKYSILGTQCVLVHEMRLKYFPHVSRGTIKSHMRRLDLMSLLAPRKLAMKLTQKYGKKKGGYYLTPAEHAKRLLETRATLDSSPLHVLQSQNAIHHTPAANDATLSVSHSITHGTGPGQQIPEEMMKPDDIPNILDYSIPMQIPQDMKPDENLNLPDISRSNLPDIVLTQAEIQDTLTSFLQPSSSKDIPSQLSLPSSSDILQSSPITYESLQGNNQDHNSQQPESSDSASSDSASSIQASQPRQMQSFSGKNAEDQVNFYFLLFPENVFTNMRMCTIRCTFSRILIVRLILETI